MKELAKIAILAGGNSRRMGKNKAQLLFDQKTLLNRLIQDAKKISLDVVVCGDDYKYSEVSENNISSSPDLLLNKSGALSAIQPVLEQCKKDAQSWLWVCSCDSLLLPSELISLFNKALQEIEESKDTETKIILLRGKEKKYPLIGVYHSSLTDDLKDYLLQGERRVMVFCEKYKIKEITLSESIEKCCNFNTPEQFELAKKQYIQYKNF